MLTHINNTPPPHWWLFLTPPRSPPSHTQSWHCSVILPGQELWVPPTMEVTCVTGTGGHGPAWPQALLWRWSHPALQSTVNICLFLFLPKFDPFMRLNFEAIPSAWPPRKVTHSLVLEETLLSRLQQVPVAYCSVLAQLLLSFPKQKQSSRSFPHCPL